MNHTNCFQVYRAVPELARSGPVEGSSSPTIEPMRIDEPSSPTSYVRNFGTWFHHALSPWSYYIQSPVFLASFSLCTVYLTVLSFNAQMLTYLLDSGFTALWVAGFRLVSVGAELSATWAAPAFISKVGPVRSGLWFITWQSVCAATGVALFVQEAFSHWIRAISLIIGVILSRIGLWGFDLSIQYLVQEVGSLQSLVATVP